MPLGIRLEEVVCGGLGVWLESPGTRLTHRGAYMQCVHR